MENFIALKVSRTRLNDLEGLCSEIIAIASQQSSSVLGNLGLTKLQTLSIVNANFLRRLHPKQARELTSQISEKERLRDTLFSEIRCTSKTGQHSILPA
jgi:hypothetical protein